MKSGYWAVPIDPESKKNTAFYCHRGLFHHNVMPFGLVNTPSIYMMLMNKVLQGLSHFSLAYLDDVLIFSETLS